MTKVVEKVDHFLAAFEESREVLDKHGPPWLGPLRRNAIDRFAQIGFPSRRDEAFKYTPLLPLTQPLSVVPSGSAGRSGEVGEEQLARLSPHLGGPRLVFVDGEVRPELCQVDSLPRGVEVAALSQIWRTDGDPLRSSFDHWASLEHRLYPPEHAFAALNAAFFEDGAFLYLAPGVVLETPVEVIYFSTGAGPRRAVHTRNLVLCERGSQGSLVEIHGGENAAGSVNNVVTEVRVCPEAHFDHTKIQREHESWGHVGLLRVAQERGSHFGTGFFSFGGKVVRHEVEARLLGEGCDCELHGLYVVDGSRSVDNTTTIHHARPHSQSREVYKGILTDRAQGAFSGKIFVHEDAQKTDAKQSNDGLLLSEEAVLNARPNLEIYADDVRCTHGATVGQLNRDALFYLRSRGIGVGDARHLLIRAFAREITDGVPSSALRAHLEDVLGDHLPTEQARKRRPQ